MLMMVIILILMLIIVKFLSKSVNSFKMKEREAGSVLSKVVKQQMKVKQIPDCGKILSIKVRVAFLKSR